MSREHRIEMQKITDAAKALHAAERRITLESVYMVEELERNCVWLYLKMKPEDLAVYIGLTPNMYWARLRAARVLRDYPSFLKLYEAGETQISHIAMLYTKLTAANENVILAGIKDKTKREVESLLSRVKNDGKVSEDEGITEITVRFTDSERKIFERAREILAHGGHVPTQAETILKASALLVERCDPLKKVERAAARADRKAAARSDHTDREAAAREEERAAQATDSQNEAAQKAANHEAPIPLILDSTPIGETESRNESKTYPQVRVTPERKPIPAAIRHKVWLTDQGQCTYVNLDGTICGQHMMLEVDHIDMVCRGGTNDETNLRLRCRFHNAWQAELELGGQFMKSKIIEQKLADEVMQ